MAKEPETIILPPHSGQSGELVSYGRVVRHNPFLEHKNDQPQLGSINTALQIMAPEVAESKTKKKKKNKNKKSGALTVAPASVGEADKKSSEPPVVKAKAPCEFVYVDIISQGDPYIGWNYFKFGYCIILIMLINWFTVAYYMSSLLVWFVGLTCTAFWASVMYVGRRLISRGLDKLRTRINELAFGVKRIISLEKYTPVDLYHTHYNRSIPYAHVYKGRVAVQIHDLLLSEFLPNDMSKEGNRIRARFYAESKRNSYSNSVDITSEVIFDTVAAVSWKLIALQNRDRLAFGSDDMFPRTSFD